MCSLVFRTGGSEDAQVKLISDRIIEYARACMFNGRRTSPFESKMRSFNLLLTALTSRFSRGSGHEWATIFGRGKYQNFQSYLACS
jgi:hypothetical protein